MQGSTFSDDQAAKFDIRAAALEDLVQITGLLHACSQRWHRRPTSTQSVADRLAQPGTSPALDTVVVVDVGQILAFGHTWTASAGEVRYFGRVHPDHRGRGIGTILVQEMIARARCRKASGEGGHEFELTTTTPSLDALAGLCSRRTASGRSDSSCK